MIWKKWKNVSVITGFPLCWKALCTPKSTSGFPKQAASLFFATARLKIKTVRRECFCLLQVRLIIKKYRFCEMQKKKLRKSKKNILFCITLFSCFALFIFILSFSFSPHIISVLIFIFGAFSGIDKFFIESSKLIISFFGHPIFSNILLGINL